MTCICIYTSQPFMLIHKLLIAQLGLDSSTDTEQLGIVPETGPLQAEAVQTLICTWVMLQFLSLPYGICVGPPDCTS